MRLYNAKNRHIWLDKVGNQAKQLKCSGKSSVSYQFRVGVQTYGHRPQYTADNDAAIWCLAVAPASTIGHCVPLQNQLATCKSGF